VTSREFRDRLARRLQRAGTHLPDEEAISRLEAYMTLLARWNAKINLTALPVDKPTDDAFDRLLVEPLAAARQFPDSPIDWFDVGSGGGSPAIPLKIMLPRACLTMVESKVRKAAFLREAVRSLDLSHTAVENARFEELAEQFEGTAQIVTVRAVKADTRLSMAAFQLLRNGGRLLLFQPTARSIPVPQFEHAETVQLANPGNSYLGVYRRVFHVEQQR
jgi:16S rRNA (guanine527-N7)-methyltransferase